MNEQLRRAIEAKRASKRSMMHQRPLLTMEQAKALLAKHAKEVAILAQARRAEEEKAS